MSLEIDPKQIKSFSPINSLNPENVQDLIKKITASKIQSGHYIFKKGRPCMGINQSCPGRKKGAAYPDWLVMST